MEKQLQVWALIGAWEFTLCKHSYDCAKIEVLFLSMSGMRAVRRVVLAEIWIRTQICMSGKFENV